MSTQSFIDHKGNVFISLLLFAIPLFANSFLTWLMLTIHILVVSNKKEKFFVWSIMSILLISLYNATKIPQNDLAWYVEFYNMAGKMPFREYITMLSSGKEQIYQILVWIIYAIFPHNDHFFVFVLSMISYSFLLKGLWICMEYMQLTHYEKILICAILFFFPYLFTISVHIVRQFMAMSIIIYVICEKACRNNNLWWLACVGMLIHTSVVFFIPFLFIKQMKESFKMKNIPIYGAIIVGLISLQILAYHLGSLFSETKMEYLVQKVAQGTTYETTFALSKLLFSIFVTFSVFLSVYKISPNLKKMTYPNFMVNISIILFLFIVFNNEQTELQLRYSMFYWLLLPFLFCIFIKTQRLPSYILIGGSILLFIFWNFYNISLSEWEYTCCKDYYYYPLIYYFQ